MSRISRFVIATALCAAPLAARAEGKCGDDPKLWKDPAGRDVLVVTWTLPFPAAAQVSPDADKKLMSDLDASFGAEPPGFPAEYGSNVVEFPYPKHPKTGTTLKSVKEVQDWLQPFGMNLEPEAVPIYEQYFREKRLVYGSVVQHPPAPGDGRGFRFCTCMLQRAVALWDGGQQQLWIRSRYRSARDSRTFVNFVPAGPLKLTFASQSIWFPLAFNRILPEPGAPAFLLLDVLTRNRLDEGQIPAGFGHDYKGTVQHAGSSWHVVRIWRRFQRSDDATDLSLPTTP